MSASEKLERLNEEMAPIPWTFVYASYAEEFPDESNLVRLRNALPEIISVVKAMEDEQKTVQPLYRMRDCLRALNERLSA